MIVKYKRNFLEKTFKCGVTLIEMTVVILVLLTLIAVSITSISSYNEFKDGTAAAQVLRNVYNAQRTFLSENPTVSVDSLTPAVITPYLSETADDGSGNLVIPTIEQGDITYGVDVSVSPPVFTVGGVAGATPFDPSGSTSDGLWDVGQ